MVRAWRKGGAGGVEGERRVVGSDVGGVGGAAEKSDGPAAAPFPLARDGRCVDLQVFSCLQVGAAYV